MAGTWTARPARSPSHATKPRRPSALRASHHGSSRRAKVADASLAGVRTRRRAAVLALDVRPRTPLTPRGPSRPHQSGSQPNGVAFPPSMKLMRDLCDATAHACVPMMGQTLHAFDSACRPGKWSTKSHRLGAEMIVSRSGITADHIAISFAAGGVIPETTSPGTDEPRRMHQGRSRAISDDQLVAPAPRLVRQEC
jgi:hypothetical protein